MLEQHSRSKKHGTKANDNTGFLIQSSQVHYARRGDQVGPRGGSRCRQEPHSAAASTGAESREQNGDEDNNPGGSAYAHRW